MPLFKCTFNQIVPTFIAFYSTFHHIKGYYIIEVFYDTVKVAFSLPADSQTIRQPDGRTHQHAYVKDRLEVRG